MKYVVARKPKPYPNPQYGMCPVYYLRSLSVAAILTKDIAEAEKYQTKKSAQEIARALGPNYYVANIDE